MHDDRIYVAHPPPPRPAWASLTAEQKRFCFLHAVDPRDPDIHICHQLRITGPLDASRLRASVMEVARDHDVLRGYCRMAGDRFELLLRDEVDAAFVLVDLASTDEPVRTESAARVVERELAIEQPFSLEEGPLFRVTLVRLGPTEHIIVARFHHVILDGTSVELFVDELWRVYRALGVGGRVERTETQFRDYVAWDAQRDHATNAAHWSAKLADPPTHDLTLDMVRPPSHTGSAGVVSLALPGALRDAIQRACKSFYVTPYVVMVSALQVAIHRVTGDRDVLIGSPISNRPRTEFRSMLGVLVNWIAFRARLEPETTFEQLLLANRVAAPESYTRQCSYEAMVSASGVRRDPSRNALFQVTLNYATRRDASPPPELEVERVVSTNDRTRFDLSLRIEDAGASSSVELTYYEGAMARASAAAFTAGFLDLIAELLEQPTRRVAETRAALPLAGRPHGRIVVASTFTALPLKPTLAYWFERLGLTAEIEFPLPGQVFHALAGGAVTANRAATNVILVRPDDWQDQAAGTAELLELLALHAERATGTTIVVSCPSPTDRPGGSPSSDLGEALQQLASRSQRLHHLSWTDIAADYAVVDLHDADADAYAQVPYTAELLIALATAIARKVDALARPAPKVVVVDCDQTLWRGVVGEDGVEGLAVDPARRQLQELLVARSREGMLVCLASKNNEADVWQAFSQLAGMALSRTMITAHRINWRSKAANVAELADELGLGVESFVVLDDSPVECAEISAAHPSATVIQVPTDPVALEALTRHLWPLDPRVVTDADRTRQATYAANREREQLRATTPDLAAFVMSLEVRLERSEITPELVERVAQLSQRTNQFNSTTVRRSASDVAAWLGGGGELLAFKVRDRFGDYGVVCVAFYRVGTVLEVDDWMISCRALGRGVEHLVLGELGTIAATRGVSTIEVPYVPTARNQPARDFLDAVSDAARVDGAAVRYAISTSRAQTVTIANAASPTGESPARRSASPPRPGKAAEDLWQQIAHHLTSANKIAREIHRASERGRDGSAPFVAPRTALERTIAAAWVEVLHLDRVGVLDDFFALGGDSVLSLAVVSRLRREGLRLEVLELHANPTVSALATLLDGRSPASAPVDAPPPAPTHASLAFAQRYIIDVYARHNLAADATPTGAYHIQERIQVRDALGHSMAALETAIGVVVARLPALRSRLVRHGDDWLQVVDDDAPPNLVIEDLTARDPGGHDELISAAMYADRMRPFDPMRETPMRFYAFTTSRDEFALVISAHHGFCDGWSLQVMFNDLFEAYDRARRGAEGATHDAVPGELARRQGADVGEHAAYWMAYSSRRRARAPLAEARPAYQPRLVAACDWAKIEQARARARSLRISLKAALLDDFAVAYAAHLRCDEPVIAVVTSGRRDDVPRPLDEFGLCWTFAPLVVDVGRAAVDRLAQVHADLLAAEAHARYPVEAMFGGAPETIAHASFNLTNFHNARWRRGRDNLHVTQVESFHRFHFQFNFAVRLDENLREASIKVNWSPSLDEGAVRAVVRQFVERP